MRVWRNWQTRMIQVHIGAIRWRFKSSYPHQKRQASSDACRFYLLLKFRANSGKKTAVRHPACLHSRMDEAHRQSNRGTTAPETEYFPVLFVSSQPSTSKTKKSSRFRSKIFGQQRFLAARRPDRRILAYSERRATKPIRTLFCRKSHCTLFALSSRQEQMLSVFWGCSERRRCTGDRRPERLNRLCVGSSLVIEHPIFREFSATLFIFGKMLDKRTK